MHDQFRPSTNVCRYLVCHLQDQETGNFMLDEMCLYLQEAMTVK